MYKAFSLPEQAQIVGILNPAADAAGRTGAYVSLKNGTHAYFVVHLTQGNAAQITVSVLQAQTVGGTGSKAGPSCRIWYVADTSTTDALVLETAAASFQTDVGLKNKIIIIEVDSQSLDLANGFGDVTISTSASNAANITQAAAYIVGQRYAGASLPSAIVD